MIITLPWPPSGLSGHNNGSWKSKSGLVKRHRDWASKATLSAALGFILPDGDINTHVSFYPPNNRSDRLNYPNRMKPYFDGISDALRVNDKRFDVPNYFVFPVSDNPRVVVEIECKLEAV